MEQPEVIFEAEWTYRTWRGCLVAVLLGLFGGTLLFVSINGFLHQRDIWEQHNWVLAGFFLALGAFTAIQSAMFFRRIVVGTRETSRIDTNGIKIGRQYWRWDQMRFIRPTRDGLGGVLILIALRRRTDRYFWIGRPLKKEEFEKLNQQLLPFLQSKYPQLIK